MCAASYNNKTKIYYKFGVRGSECFDPPHRMVRNRTLAITSSGYEFVAVEWGVVFGFLDANCICCRRITSARVCMATGDGA